MKFKNKTKKNVILNRDEIRYRVLKNTSHSIHVFYMENKIK